MDADFREIIDVLVERLTSETVEATRQLIEREKAESANRGLMREIGNLRKKIEELEATVDRLSTPAPLAQQQRPVMRDDPLRGGESQ